MELLTIRLIEQLAIPLMKLLTNRLGGKAAKSLVISQQAGKWLVISPQASKSLVIPRRRGIQYFQKAGHRPAPV